MKAAIRDSGQGRNRLLLRDANSRALRIALLVAALFAILFQSVIVQAHTHVHRAVAPIVHVPVDGARAHAVLGAADDGSTQQDESDCPICWEMAHAGAFVLPQDTVLRIPEPSAIWRGALPQSISARNGRSHAWRSRAPPLLLQA